MNHFQTLALSLHPDLESLPCLPLDQDPAFAAILATVSEIGIIEPIKISKMRIVDGRLRWEAAKKIGLETVPCVEVPESDATSLIIFSLCARRHLTDSARAYLTYPLYEKAAEEGRRRRVENLKKGAEIVVSRSKPRMPMPSAFGKTASEFAASIGLSRDLFEMAAAVHQRFEKHPDLKVFWEPKILSGEMGLGQVQQALNGKLAAVNGDTVPKADPEQLLLAFLDMAPTRLGADRWDKLGQAQRALALDRWENTFLPSLPPEFHKAYGRFLKARELKVVK